MAAKIANQVERISPKKFTNFNYKITFLDGLAKMRINQKLFDFSLEVDGELFQVHKLVLAIASDYFAAMFEADTKERKEGTVKLQNVDVVAVKALMDYIYSGIITLTEENVEAVLPASDIFQIVWVKEKCIQFLKSNLNGQNCFRVRKFADKHSYKELQNISHKYILDHLDDLITEEHLLLLPFEEMKELIKDEQHILKPSDSAYKAAINWVKHDLERRRVHLAEIMSQIRFPLVSPKFLSNHIVAEPLLRQDHKCNQLLIDALNFQLTRVTERNERWQTGTKHCNEGFHVFLVGGIRDFMANTKGCTVYDISKKKQVSISSINEGRFDNSAISLNGVVYAVGGWNRGALKTAECYDLFSKRWSYITPMNSARHNFGICTYSDLIYVVGGLWNSTVENYDPATNIWRLCPNIPLRDTYDSRATMAENSIYSLTRPLIGNIILHRFDSRDGKWYNLNEIPGATDPYELVSCDRTLFAIGKNDCNRLDIRANKWEPMSCMLSKRDHFSALITAKNIYVLGGKKVSNSELITSVERFNIHTNEWKNVDSIEIEHWHGGSAAVSGDFDFN